jgi:hypothetical protein
MSKSLEILNDPRTAMQEAARKVNDAYSGDSTKLADLYVRFANAQAQLHEATMLEVQSLFSVANSMMFSNDARTKAVARITELLNLA